MAENPAITRLCGQLQRQYHPQKILVFHQKSGGAGEVTSFKVCLVVDTPDVMQLEREIYLSVESEIPFDVLVYTPAEWERLKKEAGSFASHINESGAVYHEQK